MSGLGLVTHPGVVLQTVLEGLLQIFHQTVDTLLAALWEVLLHVELTYGLAQAAADLVHGTLPAGLLLLYARDGLAGLKAAVGEVVREIA